MLCLPTMKRNWCWPNHYRFCDAWSAVAWVPHCVLFYLLVAAIRTNGSFQGSHLRVTDVSLGPSMTERWPVVWSDAALLQGPLEAQSVCCDHANLLQSYGARQRRSHLLECHHFQLRVYYMYRSAVELLYLSARSPRRCVWSSAG